MSYNPNIHHRRSIRLKGYDYSQAGLYFVTICVQDGTHLFGEIREGEINVSGIESELGDGNMKGGILGNENKKGGNLGDGNMKGGNLGDGNMKGGHVGPHRTMGQPQMILNDAGIMIDKWWQKISEKFPDIEMDVYQIMPNHFHAIVKNNGMGVGANPCVRPDNNGDNILGEHVGSPLWRVMQWFKTMTTNEYIRGVKTLGWARFNGKLWQRDYYEHIIRNEQSYQNISNYIINNPANWNRDKFFGNEPKGS